MLACAYVGRLLIEVARHHRQPSRNHGRTMRARWAKVDPLPSPGLFGLQLLGYHDHRSVPRDPFFVGLAFSMVRCTAGVVKRSLLEHAEDRCKLGGALSTMRWSKVVSAQSKSSCCTDGSGGHNKRLR
jgi:hypothetical protein